MKIAGQLTVTISALRSNAFRMLAAYSPPFSPADAFDQYFIMFVNEIEGSVPRHESRYDLTILDQLNSDSFADRTVGLP